MTTKTKYQLFFFDDTQNRELKLQAVQPFFTSPSAINILLKTVRFDGQDYAVYVGQDEDDLKAFLSKVERADLTDWLDYDFDTIKTKLDELATEYNLSRVENLNNNEVLITGIDNDTLVTAKLNYPRDIPSKNYWLWDDIKKTYRKEIKERSKKNQDIKEAATRVLYMQAAKRLELIPFSLHTTTQVADLRQAISDDIVTGEEKASQLIDIWDRHLKSLNILKKSKAMRYLGSDYEQLTSRFYIAHAVDWTLVDENWKGVVDYFKKSHSFNLLAKDRLSITINKLTKIEVIYEGGVKIGVYISHVMTPKQAAMFTEKTLEVDIIKTLHKYSSQWYKKGKFPDINKSTI